MMENLAQNPLIKAKLKTAPKTAIQALHKLIFHEEGDRGNRKRLREFSGFQFNDDSEEFRGKLEYASRLSTGDLISICNILGLDYTGTGEQLRERIVRGLIDITPIGLENIEDDDDDENHDNPRNNAEHHANDENHGNEGNGNDGHNSDNDGGDTDDDALSDDAASATPSANSARSNESRADIRNGKSKKPFKFVLSYKDVEDSIRSYDGTKSYPIEQWIMDFEEFAIIYGWND